MSDLMERLNQPDVVEDDVLRYLEERIQEGVNQQLHVTELDVFWQPGDLGRFHDAERWWPTDAPPRFAKPSLVGLCRNVANTFEPTTFMAELERAWRRCVEWLEAEGRSVVNPNETPDERRRRKNREAVARHRQRARELSDETRAHVEELRQVWIATCQKRKAAYDAVTPEVEAALRAWEDAKAALTQSAT